MLPQAVGRLLHASCRDKGAGGDLTARVAACVRLCDGDAVPASLPHGGGGVDVTRFLARFRLASAAERDAVAAVGDAAVQEGRCAMLLHRAAVLRSLAEVASPTSADLAEAVAAACPKVRRDAAVRASASPPGDWARVGMAAGFVGDLRVVFPEALMAGKDFWASQIALKAGEIAKRIRAGARVCYPEAVDVLEGIMEGDRMAARRALWLSGSLFQVRTYECA